MSGKFIFFVEMNEQVLEKLKVLAESAKYDVSCASSGTTRKNSPGTIGSTTGWGICHSFTDFPWWANGQGSDFLSFQVYTL